MTSKFVAWFFVGATVLLTSYGQLVLKWQVDRSESPMFSFMANWNPLIQLIFRPWVISSYLAAFGASVCWIMALRELPLSDAYPFMALNFLIVCLLAVPMFGETVSILKLTGIVVVIFGLILISQG